VRDARFLLLAAVAIAAAGCRKAPEACVVTGMTVEEAPGPSAMRAVGIEREELRRIGLEAVGATPGFEVPAAPPREGARRCRGSISLVDARVVVRGNVPTAEALVRVDVTPGDDADAVGDTVPGRESVAPGEPAGAAFRRAIRSAAARAASGVALALAEARKTDEAVVRDLDSGDPRIRDLAVGVLADRKSPAAVPGLIARLQDPDPLVADRAVGALAQIGDPRAVGPIIALARRREGPFVAQMVRAIGDIGGPEAEAYLETMAAGHPDPQVVEAAKEALRDARRRRARGL
jgi:hypothetical protein